MTSNSVAHSKTGAAKAAPIPAWIDALILIAMLATVAVALSLSWQSGSALFQDNLLSWHLVRSIGIIAYTMLGSSTLWGIFLSSRIIKDWSPGATSLLLHATTSWLAVVFSILHALLLLPDEFVPYRLVDILIPFGGPYRPVAVGLGIIGMWAILTITVSFSLRKWIGQKTWRWLHYTSYATFILITVHAMLSGTDSGKAGMQFVMLAFGVVVILMFIWRVVQMTSRHKTRHPERQRLE